VIAAAAALPERFTFIGGHPLAGAATGGLESARPDLFAGRPWLLTRTTSEVPRELTDFIDALGAKPQVISADEHDSLVAYLSHLPQLAASALMHVVGHRAGEEGLALAGRGLSDTTRLASSPAAIWRDIAATNRDNLSRAIDELIEALQQLKPGSADGGDALERTFESAARWKQVLEKGRQAR
jgi:prephenate dehydrogenase